jgi:hypothetical protein
MATPASAAPQCEFVLEERVRLGPPQVIGETPDGVRRFVPIIGGDFTGPRVQGEILAGGGDMQILRNDGVDELHARYTLRTDAGDFIYVHVDGLRTGSVEVMQRLRSGQPVDPADYYFRAVPRFETPAPELQWMTRSVFLATGERYPDEVFIRFWRVL